MFKINDEIFFHVFFFQKLQVFAQEYNISAANNLSCLCRKPDRCPVQGTMDMFPCLNVPVLISNPHFYHADPSLLANVASGLKPEQKKHEFAITLELVGNCEHLIYNKFYCNMFYVRKPESL